MTREWKNQPEDILEHKKCIGKHMKDFALTAGLLLCIAAIGMLFVIIIAGYPATGHAATAIYAIGLGAIAFILAAMYSAIKKITNCKSGET